MSLVGEGLAVAQLPGPVDMAALGRSAARQALTRLGAAPNLALVFVATAEPDTADEALVAAYAHLRTATVLGASAQGVIATGRGVGGGAAVAVWASRIPDLRARTFHLDVVAGPHGQQIVGLPGRRRDDVAAMILTDPWSFPTEDFAAHARSLLTDLPVIGAVAGTSSPGTTRFLLDGRLHTRGAVGIMLGGRAALVSLSSPASRPVGPVLTVTDAEGFLLKSLAGSPAALRAQEVAAALEEPDRGLALRGMQLGVAVGFGDPAVGDFVIHDVHPAHGERGALEVAGPVPVGASVQFQVRDPAAADEDLNVMLEGVAARMGSQLLGAVMFSSAARADGFFGSPDHDAGAAHARLGVPVAGLFSQAEMVPMGERTCVNRQSATVLAFGGGPRVQPGHESAVRPRRISEVDAMDLEVRRMLADLAQRPDDGPT